MVLGSVTLEKVKNMKQRIKQTLITLLALGVVALGKQDELEKLIKNTTGGSKSVQITDFSNTSTVVNGVEIPQYTGEPYVTVNNNEPYFLEEELTNVTYVSFSSLDKLERQGVADAVLGPETLQFHERGSISQFHPSGWWEAKETDVNINRCHLIGNQLAGDQSDCLENLVTGSRYMNVDGMLPFENQVDDYIEDTANHVRYRVTPVFEGNDVTCKGVLMEAESVEDPGSFKFCVWCYNVEPDYVCDYLTGKWEYSPYGQ